MDPDGRFPAIIWDAASIGMGIHNLVKNVKAGNVWGAVGDGAGIVIDVAAAIIPFAPGGVGAIRAGAKTVDAATGVAKSINAADKATDATKAAASVSDGKVYVTYTKVNPKTGEVYSGRASGNGTPKEVVAKRDRNHHMNEKGFEPAELDRFSTNSDAIRGREQQPIELNGGAKSQGGSSGNAINGVSPTNPNKDMKMQEKKSSVSDKKQIRQRRVVGAVMEINIDDEYYVYAQSYPHSQEVVFDYRSSEPLEDLSVLLSAKQLFRVAVYRRVIGSGYWKKVGKLPLREDLLPIQMEYVYHKYDDIQFEIYNPATGKMTPATKEECRGLEPAAVWDYMHVKQRIKDYYNGLPCSVLKETFDAVK